MSAACRRLRIVSSGGKKSVGVCNCSEQRLPNSFRQSGDLPTWPPSVFQGLSRRSRVTPCLEVRRSGTRRVAPNACLDHAGSLGLTVRRAFPSTGAAAHRYGSVQAVQAIHGGRQRRARPVRCVHPFRPNIRTPPPRLRTLRRARPFAFCSGRTARTDPYRSGFHNPSLARALAGLEDEQRRPARRRAAAAAAAAAAAPPPPPRRRRRRPTAAVQL